MKKEEYTYDEFAKKEIIRILIPYILSPILGLIFTLIGVNFPIKESIYWFIGSLICVVLFFIFKSKLIHKTKEIEGRNWDV